MLDGVVAAVLVLAFLAIASGAALVVRRIWTATAGPGSERADRADRVDRVDRTET